MKLLNYFYHCLLSFILLYSTSLPQQITWLHTTGPVAESIKCFSVLQEGTMLCGTASNGIYISNDFGNSWSNSSTGLSASDVNSIYKAQSGTVFAGLNGGGVNKSTNSGESWEQTAISLLSITSISENSSGDIFAAGWGAIYKSTDDGVSWDTLSNGLPSADWIEALVINTSQRIICVTGINGVFYSDDNGESFISSGLSGVELNSIVKNPFDYLFVSSNGSGVYKSTDNGLNWTEVNSGLNDLFVNTLWSDNNNNLFAGLKNGRVYLSINNGTIWQPITTAYSLSEVNSILSDLSQNVFAGTNLNGIFCASEGSYKWNQCNEGLKSSEVINLLAIDSTQVFAATNLNGIFRTSNKGGTWINNALQGNIGMTLSLSNNKNIYAGLFAEIGFFGDKLRSDDNGYSWISIGAGLPIEPAYDFAFTKHDEVYTAIAGASAEIYYSSDSGSNWNKISGSLSNPVYSVAVNSLGTIFAGSNSGIIYRLAAGALNWTELDVNSPNAAITKIAVNHKDYIFAVSNTGGGIFRSTDNGNNWQSLAAGLLDTVITSIYIDPNDLVFIATSTQGVYYSKENGDTWIPTSSLIPLPNVTSLTMDDEGYLYAGTRFNGVYRTFQTLTDVEDQPAAYPSEFLLEQNYPNPFNPSTKIRWQAPAGSWQTLKIYDVLGNEIAILVNEYREAGSYEINFDASSFSSGVYYYQLKVGNFIETRKMILLR
ncbi:MAG: T9SS type A sorting domain-containing protein [Ignavibacteriales bacterium]|nr:T9SS type A sorting domain-containing protein [Ignavibacteriales bacterium]